MEGLLRQLAAINTRADYSKTLALLEALKAGTIFLDQVELTADGWQLRPPEPAEPASDTID